MKKLNNRIKWMLDNTQRGITYIPIDISTAKIYLFVDGSFANNDDLSSQIGYIIMIGNEKGDHEQQVITRNIVHWSSTKCKRVTRSVLASEIYAMATGVDIAFSISNTINSIIKRLGHAELPLVVCTDSYSLFECVVKLGSTKEKRLMIDIMALRQMYEARELSEIRWICGDSNPADSMTKTTPNKSLNQLISTNELRLKIGAWVDRGVYNNKTE